jgi:hypothetical protein
MLKFLHKKITGRDWFYPLCDKSRALLKLFDSPAILGYERMDVLQSVIEIEIEEILNSKNTPKKHRKRNANIFN